MWKRSRGCSYNEFGSSSPAEAGRLEVANEMVQRRQQIQTAFEDMKGREDGFSFQRVVCQLLVRLYPSLNPLPYHRDAGQDAVAAPMVEKGSDGRWYLFFTSTHTAGNDGTQLGT